MAEMHEVDTAIISKQTLVREGVKALLAGSRYRVTREFVSIDRAIDELTEELDLTFVALDLDYDTVVALKSLREAFPRTHIVLYAQAIRLPITSLVDVFGSTLNGCVAFDAAPSVIRQCLDLIMLGEPVFPYSQMLPSGPGAVADSVDTAPDLMRGPVFSDREIQVLDLVRNGHPNKFIARTLMISEATVKVHLKALLRKLRLSNRTQVAIWAAQNYEARNLSLDTKNSAVDQIQSPSRTK